MRSLSLEGADLRTMHFRKGHSSCAFCAARPKLTALDLQLPLTQGIALTPSTTFKTTLPITLNFKDSAVPLSPNE